MELADNAYLPVLAGQYVSKLDQEETRIMLFNCLWKNAILWRDTPYPTNQPKLLNTIVLIHPVWGNFGEIELFEQEDGSTLLSIYQPPFPREEEIFEYEKAIRDHLPRLAFQIWFYDNLAWPAKVMDLLGQELLDQRLSWLRDIQDRLINSLELVQGRLSWYQMQPAPSVGISQIQLAQSVGISQMQAPIEPPKEEEPQDIPPWPKSERRAEPLGKDNQEVLRLWAAGLTAKEIGLRTGKTEKTILNRLTTLRKTHGEECVPRRK